VPRSSLPPSPADIVRPSPDGLRPRPSPEAMAAGDLIAWPAPPRMIAARTPRRSCACVDGRPRAAIIPDRMAPRSQASRMLRYSKKMLRLSLREKRSICPVVHAVVKR